VAILPIEEFPGGSHHIDLTGPKGNARFLLMLAKSMAKQMLKDPEPILEEMKAGDYENLIAVFDRHFSDFVTLYRRVSTRPDVPREIETGER